MSAASAVSEARAYLLAPIPNERERLALQATMWEPAAERLFDAIGPIDGWRCLDLGCGAPGTLGTLATRVGAAGHVVGLDCDAGLAAAAGEWARARGFGHVEIAEGDAFATGLPDATFDLVHLRFMFAPLGRVPALLAEADRLLRPGGMLVVQEPDASAWQCWPPSSRFEALVEGIIGAFADAGGDFNAGLRIHALLRDKGYGAIRMRSESLTLPGTHAYSRLPLLFAESLAERLIRRIGRPELERLETGCEEACGHPDARVTAFVLQQTWGRKAPAGGPAR
jgi:SAM-dependent methyltransferase